MVRPLHQDAAHFAPVRVLPFEGSDEELVRGMIRGDVRSRAACYDRFAPRVERILLRTLGRDDQVEDALQETFLIAFRDAHKIREPKKLRGWLSRVAVFVARGMLRKRGHRWLRFLAPWDVPQQSVEMDPGGSLELRAVQRVFDRLPAEERIALALRRLEEMPLAEIASVMGISLATVKRRIKKAETLFEELTASEPGLSDRLESDS